METIKELEKQFNNKIKYHKFHSSHEQYKVTITWDANDGNYIPAIHNFKRPEFEEDILLKLVLCLMDSPIDYNITKQNKIMNYLNHKFNDMFSINKKICSGINYVNINLYKNGKLYNVYIPSILRFFNGSEDQIIEEINEMIDEYFKTIKVG